MRGGRWVAAVLVLVAASAGSAGAPAVAATPVITGLTLSTGTLQPEFDPGVTEYWVDSLNNVRGPRITVAAATTGWVKVNGSWVRTNTATRVAIPTIAPGADIVVSAGSATYRIHTTPPDLPAYTFTSRRPTEGATLVTPWLPGGPEITSSLMAVDSRGRLRFYRQLPGVYSFDFRQWRLPGGVVRYSYLESVPVFSPVIQFNGRAVVMDRDFRVIDTVETLVPTALHPALLLDIHEFTVLGDGHYRMMANYDHVVTNVPPALTGGAGSALVTSTVIQEVDHGEVVFDWDSAQHPEFYGWSTDGNDFTSTTVHADYMHANSVTVDPADGNFVVSARHLDAVFEIDRDTGAVNWVLGGPGDQFGLPPEWQPSHQHTATLTGLGVLMMFDNANATGQTRVLRLTIDQRRRKVTATRQYGLAGWVSLAMGSAYRMSGGRDLVGYGFSDRDVVEYDRVTGTVRMSLDLGPMVTYRAHHVAGF